MCGLPSWAVSRGGVFTKLHIKAANRFGRDRRITVWCCTESCALQSRAVAQMGPASHKWPMTLAEFASWEGSNRYETPAQTRINTGAAEADFQEVGLPYTEAKNVTKPLPNGRPRKFPSTAARMRAYRQRHRSGVGVQ